MHVVPYKTIMPVMLLLFVTQALNLVLVACMQLKGELLQCHKLITDSEFCRGIPLSSMIADITDHKYTFLMLEQDTPDITWPQVSQG